MKWLLSLGLVFCFGYASVDINTADVGSFSSLKGVGKKKAEAIVAYRKEHGCFENVDALYNVKGIGNKILSDNKNELSASACKK